MGRKKPKTGDVIIIAPKRKPEDPDDYAGGTWEVEFDEELDPPWGISVVLGNVRYLVASLHPAGDASDAGSAYRIVACVNALDGIPTSRIRAGIVAKLWVAVSDLCDLLEGKKAPVDDQDAYRSHVIGKARALVACLNKPEEGAG